jgi:hypothetical protein
VPTFAVLVDDATIEQLTGTVQPKRQAAWLEAHGWEFEPPERRGQRPRVSRAYFEARMAGKADAPRRSGPRLDWMRR